MTHINISDIKHLIRDQVWDRLYKSSSERRPYQKAVSYTYFKHRGHVPRDKNPKFEKFLDRIVRSGKCASFPQYSIDGRSVADDYIRLECFETDFRRIGQRLGIPIPEQLPRKRVTERDDSRPAREILTPEQRDVVYEHCKPKFKLFNYER